MGCWLEKSVIQTESTGMCCLGFWKAQNISASVCITVSKLGNSKPFYVSFIQ